MNVCVVIVPDKSLISDPASPLRPCFICSLSRFHLLFVQVSFVLCIFASGWQDYYALSLPSFCCALSVYVSHVSSSSLPLRGVEYHSVRQCLLFAFSRSTKRVCAFDMLSSCCFTTSCVPLYSYAVLLNTAISSINDRASLSGCLI